VRREFVFLKYEGCGNDFILKDELSGPVTPDRLRSKLAMRLCDRHFAIGGHGILFVESAKGVDGSMRLFEPDGGEADMCGNGIRCVAAFLAERLARARVDILTRDGIKRAVKVGDGYRVDMGQVRYLRKDLKKYFSDGGSRSDPLLGITLRIGGKTRSAALMNSGEPHLVVLTDDIASVDMAAAGEAVNKDRKRFPRGVNINFVEIMGPRKVKMRTYERGVFAECLACGTGAVASAAALQRMNKLRKGTTEVVMLGGSVKIDIDPDGNATMTGPAQKVFEGRLSVDI
jgi:diaminopimelate epimerase